jgi:DNA-binding response OmpR family regulator
MPIRNQPKKRCLLLSTDQSVIAELNALLLEAGYVVDILSDRKSALYSFLHYRHHLFVLDVSFLPRYPYRLMQLFKIAHRTPGVLILNGSGKDLTGFIYLPEGVIEIVEAPFKKDRFHSALEQIDDKISARTRELFFRDWMVQAGIAVPVIILLIYLVLKYGV